MEGAKVPGEQAADVRRAALLGRAWPDGCTCVCARACVRACVRIRWSRLRENSTARTLSSAGSVRAPIHLRHCACGVQSRYGAWAQWFETALLERLERGAPELGTDHCEKNMKGIFERRGRAITQFLFLSFLYAEHSRAVMPTVPPPPPRPLVSRPLDPGSLDRIHGGRGEIFLFSFAERYTKVNPRFCVH